MSTWTSRVRAALALAGALALPAACFETQAMSGALTRVSDLGPAAVSVLGGVVTVAGPEGWCVDARSTRETGDQAFVLLVRCRERRGEPVLSVTVSDIRVPPGEPVAQLTGLADFLLTEVGRGQLSRRGRADEVTIRSHRIADGALWLELSDSGNPERFAPDYWRVVMPLAGRLVTLSAMALAESPSPPEAGVAALEALIAVLRRRNLE
jgi:hypothetical protein